MIGGIVGVLAAAFNGVSITHQRELQAYIAKFNPSIVLIATMATGVVSVVLAKMWMRNDELTWLRRGEHTRRDAVIAAIAGALLAIAYLYVAVRLLPPAAGTKGGPLAEIARQGGSGRAIWAIIAIVLAPPIEEFLFRGVLLQGFARSWGMPIGGLIVAIIFTAMHISEIVHYWPAAAAILALALCTFFARLVARSIMPAIVLHLCYNLIIVIAVYRLSPA